MIKYAIYGLGEHFKNYIKQEAIENIDFFIDKNYNNFPFGLCGKPVVPPPERKNDMENTIIIVCTYKYYYDICLELEDKGYQEGRDFFWSIKWRGDNVIPSLYDFKTWDMKKANWYMTQNDITVLRSRLAARFIPDSFTVVDLGAGNMKIREYLKSNCKYIPVDYEKVTDYDGTFVKCNFNKKEFPKELNCDCVVALGIDRLILDFDWFCRNVLNILKIGGYFIISMTEFNEKMCNEYYIGQQDTVFIFDRIEKMQKIGFKFDNSIYCNNFYVLKFIRTR